MGRFLRQLQVLLLVLVFLLLWRSSTPGFFAKGCNQEELKALVKFEKSAFLRTGAGESWIGNGTQCCRRKGISCDYEGYVTRIEVVDPLELDPWGIYAINTSLSESLRPLLELRRLIHLDLTGFQCWQSCMIPEFLGSMKQLQFLGLPFGLSGNIPPTMGNLTNLRTLILAGDSANRTSFVLADIQWLSDLVHLTRFDLMYTDVLNTGGLSRVLGTLPYLTELTLISCGLGEGFLLGVFSDSALVQSTGRSDPNHTSLNQTMEAEPPFGGNLEQLTVSQNNIGGPFPDWLRNQKHLQLLQLPNNQLTGDVPIWLGELAILVILDLSGNRFSGNIPSSLGQLSELFSLDLSRNRFSGSVPSSLRRLSYLSYLDLSQNSLDGVIMEADFSNLSKLKTLDLSENHLTIKLNPQWVPPFQLQTIRLGSCSMTNGFPHWVRTQKEIRELHLPNTSISDVLPGWIGEMRLSYLNLSNSRVFGPLPNLPKELLTLDISHNNISGSMLRSIVNISSLEYMDVHNNMIGGSIPSSMCNWRYLSVLNLAKNRFSGIIPDCWDAPLLHLDLSSNYLSGSIPNSIGRLSGLFSLHLNDNHLIGEIPWGFIYLNQLVLMDLGGNNLDGNIPEWIGGMTLLELQFLRLRENDFYGEISSALCTLESLQVLDLSGNRLMGNIPPCLGLMRGFNLGRMEGSLNEYIPNLPLVEPPASMAPSYTVAGPTDWSSEHVNEVIKGRGDDYTRIDLKLVTNLDLSSNEFVGMIPRELESLFGLRGLNLSHNRLNGSIPSNIREMKSLESLDLSDNLLSGRIPPSIAALTSLSHLNLSRNNLLGEIPKGSQIQTLEDPSNFADNPLLCAEFLPRKCHPKALPPVPGHPGEPPENDDDHSEDKLERILLCIFLVSGFAGGFCGVVGSLVLNDNWRRAHFAFAERVEDWVKVAMAAKAKGLKRWLRNPRTG